MLLNTTESMEARFGNLMEKNINLVDNFGTLEAVEKKISCNSNKLYQDLIRNE